MSQEAFGLRRRAHPSGAPAGLVRFASPAAERTLGLGRRMSDAAALLDLYEERWEYEPFEFPLRWDVQGTPVSGFRPDFWLPERGLFIELTTAEQRLVTRKNGKVRRMRELYPEVAVLVAYQRDFLALLDAHGLDLTVSSAA